MNIKTFDDLLLHLELEAKRLKALKARSSTYVTKGSSPKGFTPKPNNFSRTILTGKGLRT